MTHTPDAWIESVFNGAISDEESYSWPPEDDPPHAPNGDPQDEEEE